jgi:hypothetical protein
MAEKDFLGAMEYVVAALRRAVESLAVPDLSVQTAARELLERQRYTMSLQLLTVPRPGYRNRTHVNTALATGEIALIEWLDSITSAAGAAGVGLVAPLPSTMSATASNDNSTSNLTASVLIASSQSNLVAGSGVCIPSRVRDAAVMFRTMFEITGDWYGHIYDGLIQTASSVTSGPTPDDGSGANTVFTSASLVTKAPLMAAVMRAHHATRDAAATLTRALSNANAAHATGPSAVFRPALAEDEPCKGGEGADCLRGYSGVELNPAQEAALRNLQKTQPGVFTGASSLEALNSAIQSLSPSAITDGEAAAAETTLGTKKRKNRKKPTPEYAQRPASDIISDLLTSPRPRNANANTASSSPAAEKQRSGIASASASASKEAAAASATAQGATASDAKMTAPPLSAFTPNSLSRDKQQRVGPVSGLSHAGLSPTATQAILNILERPVQGQYNQQAQQAQQSQQQQMQMQHGMTSPPGGVAGPASGPGLDPYAYDAFNEDGSGYFASIVGYAYAYQHAFENGAPPQTSLPFGFGKRGNTNVKELPPSLIEDRDAFLEEDVYPTEDHRRPQSTRSSRGADSAAEATDRGDSLSESHDHNEDEDM